MSNAEKGGQRRDWLGPLGTALGFLGACGVFVGEFGVIATMSGDNHYERVDVKQGADAPAIEHSIAGNHPASIDAGTLLTAKCTEPNGDIFVAEDGYRITWLYSVKPEHLQLHDAPGTPQAEWVGKLDSCNQPQ